MALPTRDWSIVLGHNNAGTLVRWTSITVSGATLLDPGAPPTWTQYQAGIITPREDLSIAFEGFPSIRWEIPIMTVAQYKSLYDTYQGELVTIRDTIDGVTFANYNATFRIEERLNLASQWELFGANPDESLGYAGEWGWSAVPIFYTGMEAL